MLFFFFFHHVLIPCINLSYVFFSFCMINKALFYLRPSSFSVRDHCVVSSKLLLEATVRGSLIECPGDNLWLHPNLSFRLVLGLFQLQISSSRPLVIAAECLEDFSLAVTSASLVCSLQKVTAYLCFWEPLVSCPDCYLKP